MRLLNLVEKNDGVGVTPHLFGELTTFFIPHVTGRGSNEAADGELLHVFAHVDANQRLFRIKHEPCEYLRQLRFTNTGWAEENERANGLVGVLQSRPVTLDGARYTDDGILLANDLSLQIIVHAGEASRLLLSNALHGDTRHHTNDVAHVINGNGHPLVFAVLLPLELGFFELIIQRSLRIPQPSGFFIALRTNHPNFFLLDVFNLLLNLNDFIGDIDVV